MASDLGIKQIQVLQLQHDKRSCSLAYRKQSDRSFFPQGQTVPTYSAWTWNNYVMISGQDDVAFLQSSVSESAQQCKSCKDKRSNKNSI